MLGSRPGGEEVGGAFFLWSFSYLRVDQQRAQK